MSSLTYARRKTQGLCVVCGNEKAENDTCTVCSDCRKMRNKDRQVKCDNGICVNCGAKSDGRLCDTCKKKENARGRAIRKANKEKGLCIRCGKKTDKGHSTCAECRKYGQDNRKMYTEMGICYVCKINEVYGDEKLCPECRAVAAEKSAEYHRTNRDSHNEKQRIYSRNRYKDLIDKGLCTKCGKKRAISGNKKCGVCQNRENEGRRIQRINKLVDRPNRCTHCNNDSLPGMKVCEVHRNNLIRIVNLPQSKEARKRVKAQWY